MIHIIKNNQKSIDASKNLKKWKESYKSPSDKVFDVLCKEMKVKDLWELLDTGENYNKEQLREDLHTEQNGVCCYCVCEIELEKAQSVIEHFKDKSCNPCENTYDYTNLLLSCIGNNRITDYMVKQGDNLEKIKEKFSLTEEEISELPHPLKPFTKIKLPEPPLHCDKAKAKMKKNLKIIQIMCHR